MLEKFLLMAKMFEDFTKTPIGLKKYLTKKSPYEKKVKSGIKKPHHRFFGTFKPFKHL